MVIMLKIKLFPVGKKHQRKFRIVVAEARSKLDGTYVEALGFYDPAASQGVIKFDKDRYTEWMRRGAKPTTSVRHLANQT